MEGQQIKAGMNPVERIQVDLSLKESLEDSKFVHKYQ
jgi:hypothetical protein